MDKLTQKLQELREETEQVRRDSQAIIQAYQESQENKAQTLGTSLWYPSIICSILLAKIYTVFELISLTVFCVYE